MITHTKQEYIGEIMQDVDLIRKCIKLEEELNKRIAKSLHNLALYKNMPLWMKIWRLDMGYMYLILSIRLKKLYIGKKELLESREELMSAIEKDLQS
jgi:hypothetical protein